MTRTLKAVGLALVAVVAIGAVMATAAAALTPKVEVGTGDGNINAFQIGKNKLTLNGGRTVECTTVKLAASLGAVSTTVEKIKPTYENCTSTLAGVALPATVTPNGCTYTAHVGATTGTADQYAATTDIVCPTEPLEIHVYKEGTTKENHISANQLCGYRISGQSGLGSPTAINNTIEDIVGNLSTSKIKYTRPIGTIVNCGAASAEATLAGEMTITGTTTGGVAANVQIVEV